VGCPRRDDKAWFCILRRFSARTVALVKSPGSINSFFVKPASMTGLERILGDYRLYQKMTCKPVMDAGFRYKLLRNFNPNRRHFPFTAHAR